MHNKKTIITLKGTAKTIAVSFFFSSLIILLSYIMLGNYTQKGINLINKFNDEQSQELNNVSFDKINRKVDPRPQYKQIWAHILIPKIDLELPVYEGSTLNVLRYGVGHHQGSYFPGEGDTIILPGHNNSKTFADLPKLKNEDEIILNTLYGKFTYKIYKTDIVHRSDEEALTFHTGKEIIILYTCYPTNSVGFKEKRYVIYAELVGEEYE